MSVKHDPFHLDFLLVYQVTSRVRGDASLAHESEDMPTSCVAFKRRRALVVVVKVLVADAGR